MIARGLLAGVVLAAALTGQPSQARDVRTVTITMRWSRFEPDVIRVRSGERVRFVLRNLDPIDHEFVVGDAAVHARHEAGTHPAHGAVDGEVSIPAADVASASYTFEGRGTVVFGCHLPRHWAYGMRGMVEVVPMI